MEVFIWTEAFNCGEILQPMLNSYVKHNKYPINVYGTCKDLKEIPIDSQLIIPHTLDSERFFSKSVEERVLRGYTRGHLGTAILWEYLIRTRQEKVFIHLDADTIFLGDAISELIKSIVIEGYAVSGSRRPYKNRPYRKNGKDSRKLDQYPDAINTDCFAFNTNFIKKLSPALLRRKILGRRTSFRPVIDFFDPVTFDIIKNGGKIKYMDSPDGGFQSLFNAESQFIKKRISFAAVGSGCNFFKNGHVGIPEGYATFALQSYSLYASQFLEKNIGIPTLPDAHLLKQLGKLDKINWCLK
jgi:hypothetical protein